MSHLYYKVSNLDPASLEEFKNIWTPLKKVQLLTHHFDCQVAMVFDTKISKPD